MEYHGGELPSNMRGMAQAVANAADLSDLVSGVSWSAALQVGRGDVGIQQQVLGNSVDLDFFSPDKGDRKGDQVFRCNSYAWF